MNKYEIIILGGGPAGMAVGMPLSYMGKKVAIIQESEEMYGGVCLNMGCMPTKALLKSASVYRNSKQASKLGLNINVESIDLKKINEIVKNDLDILRDSIKNMADNAVAEFLIGKGRFLSPNEIEITLKDGSSQVIYGDKIIIATGSKPAELPFAPFDGKRILSSDHLLKNDKLPKKLLIIGGGAIGCEFATIYNSFGTNVTIVEAESHLLPKENSKLGEFLKQSFIEQGIDIKTDTLVSEISNKGDFVEIKYKDSKEIYKFDLVLVAIGRTPRTDEINLETVGVKTERGFISINEFMQTNIENIYAIGDVKGGLMLVHAADREGSTLSKIIGLNKQIPLNVTGVPRVVFCHPEVASVGITKETDKITSLTIERVLNGRSLLDKVKPAFIQLFAYKDSKILAGASIVGEMATEMIHELTLAVENRLTLNQIKETIHAHPTHSVNIAQAVKQFKF
jgi:dihydrolipoamide dehydrogenase